jgi:hypothetical protein
MKYLLIAILSRKVSIDERMKRKNEKWNDDENYTLV